MTAAKELLFFVFTGLLAILALCIAGGIGIGILYLVESYSVAAWTVGALFSVLILALIGFMLTGDW